MLNCSHMPAELSKSPEQALQPPPRSRATTPDDPIASRLRGFGPLGLIATLAILLTGNIAIGRAGGASVVLPVGAGLVLVWRWMSQTPWRELGFTIRGRLFMLMCAHAAFDLAAVAIIYWGLESRVAHLVFR